MIGRINGVVIHRGSDHAVIEAAGVGYVVHCSERTLGMLSAGGQAALWTELVVREDLMQLYGFPSLAEKELHRYLTSVQGVGAKAAMSILGRLGPEVLKRAIAMGDVTQIRQAPGVGPKLAQRVVNELQGKAAEILALSAEVPQAAMVSGAPETTPAGPAAPAEPEMAARGAAADAALPLPGQAEADALSALVNLGYAGGEAAGAVATAAQDGAETVQELIRAALRRLGPPE